MSQIQQTVAIYGGTFNPVHNGHIVLAHSCQQEYNFERMLIMPSAMPPHKAQPIAAVHRVAMLKMAFSDSVFEIDQRELIRTGFTYTIDTVRALRNELLSNVSISFLMGADSFMHFDTWEGWQDILDCVHIVIVNRPDSDNWQASLSPRLKLFFDERICSDASLLNVENAGRIFLHAMPPQKISSTTIRQRFSENKTIGHTMMPQAVEAYINEHNLYRP